MPTTLRNTNFIEDLALDRTETGSPEYKFSQVATGKATYSHLTTKSNNECGYVNLHAMQSEPRPESKNYVLEWERNEKGKIKLYTSALY
jgi:hypothetical protein